MHTQETRERIVSAARSLFSDASYSDVSMSDIARQLHITKAALYYHFRSKTDIYATVLDTAFGELTAALNNAARHSTGHEGLPMLIVRYLSFVSSERNLIRPIIIKPSVPDDRMGAAIRTYMADITGAVAPAIESYLRDRHRSMPVPARVYASLLVGTMNGMLLEYAVAGEEIRAAELAGQIMAVLF